ncbi:carbamoyl phosphate synthase small subunit [Lactobacillus corticis]|uniref:Carbamoyl phosphate synthase small subunit n=1 Tax=Lactobacillus corticis TaxID=2201249 RepID=A0A916QK97_9LACO|nr:carbamoyl phosphate synthase small subunit [Lactobacillus corticis]GFZ27010.1 carbamoyl phosphate synthase small subunit [Lactobacillus corticis]
MKRYLILEDGSFFAGEGIGAPIISTGELAIHTGNYGFQEALTDPTNAGKILVFTTPVIGATGINTIDYESIDPLVKGVIINDVSLNISDSVNFLSLDNFLREKKVPAIYNIDTRALVKCALKQKIIKASIMDTNDDHAFDQIRALVLPKNKSATFSTKNAYAAPNVGRSVAVLDLGLKHSMLRSLSLRKVNITVLPYNARPTDIKNLRPDALVISNGPGKSEELLPTIQPVLETFYSKMPILGIGLGFLVISKFLEFELAELPFEFNGTNFPVIEQNSDRIWQTGMNIDELVYPDSINLNMDQEYFDIHTDLVAGYVNHEHKIVATAFNPEGSPGGWEASRIFDIFLQMVS